MSTQKNEQVLSPDHFRIEVASVHMPTFLELTRAYDVVGDEWSSVTPELDESLHELTPWAGEQIVLLKKFNRLTTSEQAMDLAEAYGYRLAFPWEREAFAKAHPHLQKQFPIVDLGTFLCHPLYYRACALLDKDEKGHRHLRATWAGMGWVPGYRFLFVCGPESRPWPPARIREDVRLRDKRPRAPSVEEL